jgi:hypothetical protein
MTPSISLVRAFWIACASPGERSIPLRTAAVGKRAHPPHGYYSFNLAGWHILALNSQGPIGQQTNWLRGDLLSDHHVCDLAFWHDPRWSSSVGGDTEEVSPWWDVLYEAGVDVVLNGDKHQYERFTKLARVAPQLQAVCVSSSLEREARPFLASQARPTLAQSAGW